MFAELKDMGGAEPIDLYRLEGYADAGGHTGAVFTGPESVELVIRPWQSDMNQVQNEGQSGQTPGFKVYAPESAGLKRDDRIHWKDGPFRLMNPQFDELWKLERWDAQTDERQLLHLDDVPPEYVSDIERDDGRFGGW